MNLKKFLCAHWGHKMTPWGYIQDSSCEISCTCLRCGYTETDLRHNNDEKWGYVKDGSCEQIARCGRCNMELWKRQKHTYSNWRYRYLGVSSCEREATCHRCGKIVKEKVSHELNWTSYGCYQESRCTHCGGDGGSRHCHNFNRHGYCERCGHYDKYEIIEEIIEEREENKCDHDFDWYYGYCRKCRTYDDKRPPGMDPSYW